MVKGGSTAHIHEAEDEEGTLCALGSMGLCVTGCEAAVDQD